MADSKVINLTETTTPSGDDLLYLVEDALTLPQDRKITVQNLFKGMAADLNVKDFGAKGDGVTNDSTAFALALNAANTGGASRKIVVPPGVYKIGTAITKSFSVNSDIVIEGSGSGSVIRLVTGAAQTSFTLSFAQSIAFRNLAFSGDPAAGIDVAQGIVLNDMLDAKFENCHFYGLWATQGVIDAQKSSLIITGCSFEGCASDGPFGYSIVHSYNWRRVTVRDTSFIDYGTLNGVFMSKTPSNSPAAWIATDDPLGDLRQPATGSPPTNAGALYQTAVLIENCRFDEGALRQVQIKANVGTPGPSGALITATERVILRNNNGNESSGDSGYLIVNATNVDIDNCYIGYAYLGDVFPVWAIGVTNLTIRRSFCGQRARYLIFDNVTNLRFEDNVYQTFLVQNSPAGVNLDITQEGKRAVKKQLNGTYTYADMTPTSALQVMGLQYWDGAAFQNVGGDSPKNFALSFDGGAMSADFGNFWPDPAISLGNFFWDTWVKPQGTFTGYMISDGYGGNHALLLGLTGSPAGYRITGNVYNGTGNTTFGSDEGPIENEWCHLAVGWDGTNIVTYYNGVPVGITPFAGPRKTQGVNGNLYIGGSDHSNFRGLISQVRGFDTTNPRNYAAPNKSTLGAFTVQTVLTPVYRSSGSFDTTATFLAHFFRPNPIQQDLMSSKAGLLRGLQGVFSSNGSTGGAMGHPAPTYTLDPTCPTYDLAPFPTQPVKTITPAAVPSGALIFDSFSRQDVIAAFDNYSPATFKGIGSTEGGSLGPKAWTTGGAFGILNGKAYGRFNLRSMETVDPAVANVKIHARRAPGSFNSGNSTSIVFRHADTSNYFAAFTTGTAANNQTLSLIKRVANVETAIVASTIALPAAWNELIVISKADGTLQVFADATSLYSGTDAALTANTKVGLFTYTFGLDLTNRWDSFTVFPAP